MIYLRQIQQRAQEVGCRDRSVHLVRRIYAGNLHEPRNANPAFVERSLTRAERGVVGNRFAFPLTGHTSVV